MFLYLLSQTKNTGYDTYNAVVVAAESEDEARTIHPSGFQDDWTAIYNGWCDDPNQVKVKLIGIASADTKPGIVLASFNAG